MSTAIDVVQTAQQHGAAIRPATDGFPVYAEALRRSGIRAYVCTVPAASSLFVTDAGPVLSQGAPLVDGLHDVPAFDQDMLLAAIRRDKAGELTYRELLDALWAAGCVRYELDLAARTCTYLGIAGERYVERYRAVELTLS
jgi:uncharacterized protein YbcV (DUF1398 family)